MTKKTHPLDCLPTPVLKWAITLLHISSQSFITSYSKDAAVINEGCIGPVVMLAWIAISIFNFFRGIKENCVAVQGLNHNQR